MFQEVPAATKRTINLYTTGGGEEGIHSEVSFPSASAVFGCGWITSFVENYCVPERRTGGGRVPTRQYYSVGAPSKKRSNPQTRWCIILSALLFPVHHAQLATRLHICGEIYTYVSHEFGRDLELNVRGINKMALVNLLFKNCISSFCYPLSFGILELNSPLNNNPIAIFQ